MRPEAELFMTVLGVRARVITSEAARSLSIGGEKWNLKKWELAVGLVTSGNTFSELPFKVGFHSVL